MLILDTTILMPIAVLRFNIITVYLKSKFGIENLATTSIFNIPSYTTSKKQKLLF